MTILDKREWVRPFEYEWCYRYWKSQAHVMHWNVDTVSFTSDIDQFNQLDGPTKEFVKKIFTFFTQADDDIAGYYVNKYLPIFPLPETRMMLTAFAAMEANHADAYSKLVESLGFSDYKSFLEYPQMKEKHDCLNGRPDASNVSDVMVDIAVGSAFMEGLNLFGTFVMLLSLCADGKFKGMRSVVTWSLKDESVHVQGLMDIFNTLRQEYPGHWNDETKRRIYQAATHMVELEDRFISLVYTDDLELPNLTKEQVHRYIRYLCDRRLEQLELKPVYYVEGHDIEWLDMFSNTIHSDLFQNTNPEYNHSKFDDEAMW